MAHLQFFSIAFGAYQDEQFPELPVGAAVAELSNLLETSFAAEHIPWDVPLAERNDTQTIARLRQWIDSPSDTFLAWFGHGDSVGREVALALATSQRGRLFTGLTPEKLASAIRERAFATNGTLAVVVIEACGSSRFVDLVLSRLHSDSDEPLRAMVIGTSGEGATNLGLFTEALAAVLRGAAFLASNEIVLRDLANQLYDQMPGAVISTDRSRTLVLRRANPVLPGPVSLDMRAEFDKLPPAERAHFIAKAKGSDLTEPSWFFTGRTLERAMISRWLRTAQRGMLVVTGAAGCGKSALLGNLVMQSLPSLRLALASSGFIPEVPDADRPPDGAFDAVLHLAGLTADDVIDQLAAASNLISPQEQSSVEKARWLEEALGGTTLTVLADALDESQQPVLIAQEILRPLAALPAIRVVVGTRRSTIEDPDLAEDGRDDLLRALGSDPTLIVMQRDPDAIRSYVERRLMHALSTQVMRTQTETLQRIPEVSRLIAARGDDRVRQDEYGFLFAHLAAHELIAKPAMLGASAEAESELRDLLSGGHQHIFERAVARLGSEHVESLFVLEALAFSKGRGFPMVDGIWSAAAAALAGTEITPADIGRLINSARPYLIAEVEAGQTVYRLAHATFADHLIRLGAALAGGRADRDSRQRFAERGHQQIVKRLTADARQGGDDRLNPYLVTHLAAHAAAGGADAWQMLADQRWVLDRIDPSSVATYAVRSLMASLPAEIAAVVGARHVLQHLAPADRAGVRQLAMARHGGVAAPGESTESDAHSGWVLWWANVVAQPPHLMFGGHSGAIFGLTAFTGPDGRILIATGGKDGTIRIWDLDAGTEIQQFSGDTSYWVLAVAAFTGPDDRTYLASGAQDGIVRVWDPVTGVQVRQFADRPGWVTAIIPFTGPGAVTLLAVRGEGGDVRIWDPAAGVQAGQLDSHVISNGKMTKFVSQDGRTLIATGGKDGTVRVWDPSDGMELRQFGDYDGSIYFVAAFSRTDRSAFLATGDTTKVKFWDPSTGTQTGQIPYQAAGVACMAVFAGSGSRVLVAIGGDDGVVRVWDPATGEEIRQMIGHDGPVRSMIAFTGPHGRALIASGGGDGTMRVWDPATGIEPGELANRAGGVTSLTTFPGLDGHDYIVSGGRDGKVRVWDSITGTQAGVITRDHGSAAVLVVKAYRGRFGGSHLAVGDRTQISRVYDIDTHTLIHSFPHELPGVDDITPFVDDEWGGVLFAVTEGHDVGIWGSYQIRRLTGHSGNVYAIEEFAGPDGRRWLASGSYDTTVRIWDPVSGNQIHRLTGHTDSVTVLDEFTGPDSQVRLASGSNDAMVRIWDPHAGNQIHLLIGHTGPVTAVYSFYSADGQPFLATSSVDGTVRIWDPISGEMLRFLIIGAPVRDVACLPNSLIAIAMDDGIAVLDANLIPGS